MGIKGDQSTSRRINRRLVLGCLRHGGPASRGDLAALTGLSGAAISGVIAEFVAEGIIVETDAGPSTGGRKPAHLAIDFGARRSIGIKLMHDRIDAVLTDLATVPIEQTSVALADTAPDTIVAAIVRAARDLLPDPAGLLGIGIALPGFIDAENGLCLRVDRFAWKNVPLAVMVARAAHAPVWIENDVNAYAIGQVLFGLGRAAGSALAVISGTGVGAALVIGGRIHRGDAFMAGEIGFMSDGQGLTWNDRFSELAILRGMALHEDKAAYLSDCGRDFAAHILPLAMLADPGTLIIGGEAMHLGAAYPEAIAQTLRAALPHKSGTIVFDMTNDIWARGAASLPVQHFFDFECADGIRVGNLESRPSEM